MQVWEVVHKGLGYLTLGLGALTIYLGLVRTKVPVRACSVLRVGLSHVRLSTRSIAVIQRNPSACQRGM